MSRSVSRLMHQSLAVFGERDDARRSAAAEQTYAADVSFTDPEGVVVGREAVEDKVRGLLAGAPDFVFRAAGPAREAGDLGVLRWHFGPADQAPVVSGTDIALIRDGRISALYTLLDE
ncbi:nuclear transport factor 2 family protein [Blastococcus sp. TBT05-19]|uniref:nuclear transport factor 2 family protein n=1 Tax=Blastococcus sp. TBT05-19 TaxID=2250581 RepID=UPI000DE88D72|nr:nuclear transport factor 2 family protein [Blastococcus sp. TBT05-19]RBY90228.1 nuclear transport factor 2 family protein [Blastococcus sp. TBT05-19]